MGIGTNIQGEIQVVTVDSRLVAVGDVRDLVGAVEQGIARGLRKFVLDMAGADWINSAGISALINAYRQVQDAGGDLVLARLTAKVEQILIITKLSQVFKSYVSVDEAIEAL
jgi:anti-sigma B factor antagonist